MEEDGGFFFFYFWDRRANPCMGATPAASSRFQEKCQDYCTIPSGWAALLIGTSGRRTVGSSGWEAEQHTVCGRFQKMTLRFFYYP